MFIGTDPIVSMGCESFLSADLLKELLIRGIHALSQVKRASNDLCSQWLTSVDLQIPLFCRAEWEGYINKLSSLGITFSAIPDSLVWEANPMDGSVTTRQAYKKILESVQNSVVGWRSNKLWNDKVPLKISCFGWLCRHNKILTRANLQKRGFAALRFVYFAALLKRIPIIFSVDVVFFWEIWSFLMLEMPVLPLWDRSLMIDNLDLGLNLPAKTVSIILHTL